MAAGKQGGEDERVLIGTAELRAHQGGRIRILETWTGKYLRPALFWLNEFRDGTGE